MKKILLFLCSLFATILLGAQAIEGPFLILSTPYNEDGSVNYDNLVKEAEFAVSWDICGVIWPQSNDSIDLLTREEHFAGMEALVKNWKSKKTVLTLGVNGDDIEEMLIYARYAEELALKYKVNIALCARPPYYGKTEKDIEDYYIALAEVSQRPVIIQTYVNELCPSPSSELLIRLAERYPQNYGWIKEESNNLETNNRQRKEINSPAIKTVFSAWGGWQWLYQFREIGTRGLISEKVAYSPIISLVWKYMKNGDKKGKLTEAFAMYRLMIDQRFITHDSLRGYSLHYLMRLGIFDNMLSRSYVVEPELINTMLPKEVKSKWTLTNYEIDPYQLSELDKCYDDMMKFVKKNERY